MKFLKECSKARILVIGDVILDKYIFGNVERISPEAPVPVLKEKTIEYRLGGASNVAANIASFKSRVGLIGYYSDDYYGRILLDKCVISGIESYFIPVLNSTSVKTRMIASRQQILRVDREDEVDCSLFFDKIYNSINNIINNYDVIVVSDYAKGVITNDVVECLKSYNKIIIVDPKPSHLSYYNDVFLITPNKKESSEMLNISIDSFDKEYVSNELMSKLNSNVLITLGEDGMFLKMKNCNSYNLSSNAEEVYDVTGAGDTVVACLSIAVALGMDLDIACKIANLAAGVVVGHVGTSVITINELQSVIDKEFI